MSDLKIFSEDPAEQKKAEMLFSEINSVQDIQNWMYVYFGIYFPSGTVYPTSTHAPADAMWYIYNLYKTGETKNVPQVVMIGARDSYKSLAAAALEVILFVHFRSPVLHAAAIKFQAGAVVGYVNDMFKKIRPYLEYHGWKKTSENKTFIEWEDEKNDSISLTVLTATPEGMNSRHGPAIFLDEIELFDAEALKESRMIPSVYKGKSPLVVFLSTRKYAGGLMEKEIERTIEMGGKVLAWNLLDVTERISLEEAKADQPKVLRYITASELPMSNISPDQYDNLSEKDKNSYQEIWAYAGIAEHPFLPVMKNMLVDRPQSDVGFLYKPVEAVINNFKVTPLEMANAQLLCKKPSSAGLVFPRFDQIHSVMTPSQAYEKLLGESFPGATIEDLRDKLVSLGTMFIGGGDWGFTDYTSLVVLAILPNGEAWLVDSFLANKLEVDEIVKYTKELNNKWGIDKWYVDQAYPAYIKTLRKNGMVVPDFKKIVEDGISATQSRIMDSSGRRSFFVVAHPNTQHIPDCFGRYSWAKDRKGDPIEGRPHHDDEYISDVMDSIRYPMQNLFHKKMGKSIFVSTANHNTSSPPQNIVKTTINSQDRNPGGEIEKKAIASGIQDHILKTTGVQIGSTKDVSSGKKKGKIFFSR